ncbi:hypothetical protein BDV26DRAFT_264612 [Aspergillus bertholletiae]|uniref:Uncharacterized protein n=1 Tax=Aspergillus bertholletiae TaxID=1226010 RepID=A0A5N7B4N2_9EURO|nr:hypothetical protein BDV26DRAFT_264612 [Aspergillus bertholletiae]
MPTSGVGICSIAKAGRQPRFGADHYSQATSNRDAEAISARHTLDICAASLSPVQLIDWELVAFHMGWVSIQLATFLLARLSCWRRSMHVAIMYRILELQTMRPRDDWMQVYPSYKQGKGHGNESITVVCWMGSPGSTHHGLLRSRY